MLKSHSVSQVFRLFKSAFACFLLMLSLVSKAQNIDSIYLQKEWKARWITVPGASPNGYGVYYFKKDFELSAVPKNFPVHVSGDNRYKLYVNEKLVSLGPARGDLLHWNFETVDLAPCLKTGKNFVGAMVWNEGEQRPEAQISLRTAFILQGANSESQIVNTNNTWRSIQDSSYSPIPVRMRTYYVTGPGEYIDMTVQHRIESTSTNSEEKWKPAMQMFAGSPKTIMGEYGTPGGWLLVPSSLPPMELKEQRFQETRKTEGVTVPASFPKTKTSITIPANTVASILLDQSFLTNAYLYLQFSGGKGATISIRYQEALYSKFPEKGNRNEIEGKTIIGRADSLLSDGESNQQFVTLTFRTFRYVQLGIVTKDAPLVLDDVYSKFTGYPFEFNAKLETDNAELQKILDIGWRTARLCAWETYTDCPYYEQLQYIGDGRIQALVSLYNSGDDRLVRNALNLMDYSRQPEGVTLSRHPSATPQYITTFSLWYIGMLHDYMMYGKDPAFVADKLSGSRGVLEFFSRYQQKDGSLRNVPYWLFTDWVTAKDWQSGRAPTGKNGNAALMDLQLLFALQVAADLEQKIGVKAYATLYTQRATQLKKTIQSKYWDDKRKLFADRTEKDLFSQHANALAILTGVIAGDQATAVAKKMIADSTLAPASIYFKYYLHLALIKAGLGDDYLKWLGKWRENIAMGLTTWAETSEVSTSRSDCHAWGSSPNIEFFRTVLGIDSDAPGFSKIKIEPHLGDIKTIGGKMPHPNGKVQVKYSSNNGRLKAEIEIPANTAGQFIWKGKSYPLKGGKNSINI